MLIRRGFGRLMLPALVCLAAMGSSLARAQGPAGWPYGPAAGQPLPTDASPSHPVWNDAARIPGPPTAPIISQRPDHWPGAAPPEHATPWPPAPVAAQAAQPLPEPELCEGAQIMARVGTEVILAAEVRALAVHTILSELHRRKTTMPLDALRQVIDRLWPTSLDQAIESKLLFVAARRGIPDEGFKSFMERIPRIFAEEPTGLKNLQTILGASTPEEVAAKLEALGTSLEWQRRLFAERIVAQQGVLQQVDRNGPVTHEEMLRYYRDHLADYEHTARARWQQLTVRPSRHPSGEDARATLARLGNQLLAGADFAEVAREHSDGPSASEGGLRDWTTQGSLVSEPLDRALFTLPVGQLSPIIEDEEGFHIIRVLERQPAYRTSFIEAQASIEKALQRQRFVAALSDHIKRLKAETPIWTIRDGVSTGAGVMTDRRGANLQPAR